MSCYSKQILELFYNIQNTGRIIKPEAIGRAGTKEDGTVIEFSWRVREGIIQDARFRTFGDVNAIAISSVLTTMMIGKTIDEVLSIKAEDILEHLFDNKPNYLYLTDLALVALGKTYENFEKRNNKVERKQSVISQKLREDIAHIESGDLNVSLDNLDLSEISSLEEDEKEYLRNLTNYNTAVEENSLEKSLEMIYSYAEDKKDKQSTETTTISRGRGRPRKERTPEEIQAELNKEKRGRGRPRKERTPEEIEAELNKVKRGRGRPRKEVQVADNIITGVRPTYSSFNTQTTSYDIVEEASIKKVYDLEDEEDDFGVDMFSNFTFNSKPKAQINTNEDIEIIEESIEDKQEGFGNKLEANFYNENIKTSYNPFNVIEEKRGRGRPRKERTPEEIEAELNKEKRGRGRPRKERTPEEIEAELNKEKRGRGRPRKIVEGEEDVTEKISRGRGRPRKERTPEEIESDLNKEKRGRGRPKKELTEEERLEIQNKVKRGRGRPKKDTAIFIQNIKPVNIQEEQVNKNNFTAEEKQVRSEIIEERVSEPTKEVEVENMTNSFAPANNKYTIGKSSMPYYTNTTTTTYKKVETKTNFYTNIKETYNVVSEENSVGGGNLPEEKHDTIKVESNVVEPIKVELDDNVKDLLQDDKEPENVEPLSENVNNILQKGGSIEDALKFLMDN